MHPRATPPAPTHPLPTQSAHASPSPVNPHSYTGPPRDGEVLGMPRMWDPIHPDWAQHHRAPAGVPTLTAVPTSTAALASTASPTSVAAPSALIGSAAPTLGGAMPSAAHFGSTAGFQGGLDQPHVPPEPVRDTSSTHLMDSTAALAFPGDGKAQSVAALRAARQLQNTISEPAVSGAPMLGDGPPSDLQPVLNQQQQQQLSHQHSPADSPGRSTSHLAAASHAAGDQAQASSLGRGILPGLEGPRPAAVFGVDSSDSEGPMPEIDSGSDDDAMADSSDVDEN